MENQTIVTSPYSVEEFFHAYWSELEERCWSSVILHSWESLPDQIDSDIDYAIQGVKMRELLRFLSDFSRRHGWRMIQAIEHEPGAYFCVCMQCGGNYESILLDVTSGYRRIGHHLIDAQTLVVGRWQPPGKSFYVPPAGVELRYILAKGAAKGKPFSELQGRVQQLLERDRQNCLKALQNGYEGPRMWRSEVFDVNMISSWYEKEPSFAAVRRGRRFGWSEMKLYIRRILQPTGACVCVVGEQRRKILEELGELLRPGFRRVHCITRFGVMKWFEMAIRLIKTTLVVTGRKQSADGSGWFGNRLFVNYREDDDFTKEVLDKLSLRLDSRLAKASIIGSKKQTEIKNL
jgi:hypothetical protein